MCWGGRRRRCLNNSLIIVLNSDSVCRTCSTHAYKSLFLNRVIRLTCCMQNDKCFTFTCTDSALPCFSFRLQSCCDWPDPPGQLGVQLQGDFYTWPDPHKGGFHQRFWGHYQRNSLSCYCPVSCCWLPANLHLCCTWSAISEIILRQIYISTWVCAVVVSMKIFCYGLLWDCSLSVIAALSAPAHLLLVAGLRPISYLWPLCLVYVSLQHCGTSRPLVLKQHQSYQHVAQVCSLAAGEQPQRPRCLRDSCEAWQRRWTDKVQGED